MENNNSETPLLSPLDLDVDSWKNDPVSESAAVRFSEITEKWSYKEVICNLAERYWYDRVDIAGKMIASEQIRHKKRPPEKKLTAAVYYRKIADGGAERSAAQLCNILNRMEGPDGAPLYNVILITDEAPLENEYPLDASVRREFLPSCDTSVRGEYRARFEAWQSILDRCSIDIVITGQWSSPYTLWDMLAVKGHSSRPAFILHILSFSMRPYQWDSDMGLELLSRYQICDGAVALSECDKTFIKLFCPNTHCITLPVDYLAENRAAAEKKGHVIIWTGRLDPVKQPEDLIYMMRIVADTFPDAKLLIVGDGEEDYVRALKEKVSQLGLTENIVFTGFTADPSVYYQSADVFVCTSKYEGFGFSLHEALSFSLPIVMYDLPWMTIVKKNKGIKTTEMGRPDLLAAEITTLFQDKEAALKLGREGREAIDEISRIDIGAEWKKVFSGIGQTPALQQKSDERILFEHLTVYQEQAKQGLKDTLRQTYAEKSELNKKLRQTYAEKSELNKKLQQTYAEKSEINRKLQITYGEKSERGKKIKELEKELADIKASTSDKPAHRLSSHTKKNKN